MPGAKLILASGSPRRSDLLSEAGYDFTVVKPEIEENEDTTIPIRTLTAANARLKARDVSERFPDCVVIAADTLVLLGERVFTKPQDRAEAENMLLALNGNSHHVFTAVAVIHKDSECESEFSVSTEVHFKNLSEAERADYHDRINPMDKAGAYAAQEHGELIIERIEGSMTNVIGLPIDEVAKVLEEDFGITPVR